MEFKQRNLLFLRISALLLALSALLLIICFVNYFDSQRGYFEKGAALPVVFYVIYAAAILFSLTPALLTRKELVIKRVGDGEKIHTTAQAFVGTVCILFGMLAALEVLPVSFHGEVLMTIAAGMFGYGAYVLLGATASEEKFKHLKLLCLGLSACLPIGLYLSGNSISYYPVNCVENRLTSVFAICFLIYILNEGKNVFFGKYTRYRYCAMLAVSVSGLCLSVAYVVAYMLGAVGDTVRFLQMLYIAMATLAARISMKKYIAVTDAYTEEVWAEIEAAQEIAEVEAEVESEACDKEDEECAVEESQEEQKTQE